MKEIKLTFDIKSGECMVEARGFKGNSCKNATEFLKKTLGQMTDFQKKAEWYEKNLQENGCCISNLCG